MRMYRHYQYNTAFSKYLHNTFVYESDCTGLKASAQPTTPAFLNLHTRIRILRAWFMREIQVQKLTKDNFGKYGEFLDLLDESELKKKSIFQEGFFADVVALEFNQGNQPTISVCHVKKQSENIISFLEAHQYACEGLLPLDGDVIIFVGIMDSDFRTESIEAFYVPKGTFVKLNPLIVHGTQYPVDKEDVHIVCMLPGRTFKNDMLSRRLETGEQIRITRGYKK